MIFVLYNFVHASHVLWILNSFSFLFDIHLPPNSNVCRDQQQASKLCSKKLDLHLSHACWVFWSASFYWISRNNTELRHLKGSKKDQTISEIIGTLRPSKKIKQMFPAQAGNICTSYCLEQWSHNFCTKKKIVGNIKLIDQNCNWLPVCPIYVNDCIYESMNALNLQVSPHALTTLQGGIVFFLVLIRAMIYDTLEGTKRIEIVW